MIRLSCSISRETGGGRKKISERELACHCAVLLERKFMPFAENGLRNIRAKGKRKKDMGIGEANRISKIEAGYFAGDNIVRLSLHSVK